MLHMSHIDIWLQMRVNCKIHLEEICFHEENFLMEYKAEQKEWDSNYY